MRKYAYVRVKRAKESHERTDGSYAEARAAPWFVVEHFSSHLAGAAYNFRRWPFAGRSRVFSCLLFIFLTAEIISLRPPSRPNGPYCIRTCKKRGKPRARSRIRVPRATTRHAIATRNRAALHRKGRNGWWTAISWLPQTPWRRRGMRLHLESIFPFRHPSYNKRISFCR